MALRSTPRYDRPTFPCTLGRAWRRKARLCGTGTVLAYKSRSAFCETVRRGLDSLIPRCITKKGVRWICRDRVLAPWLRARLNWVAKAPRRCRIIGRGCRDQGAEQVAHQRDSCDAGVSPSTRAWVQDAPFTRTRHFKRSSTNPRATCRRDRAGMPIDHRPFPQVQDYVPGRTYGLVVQPENRPVSCHYCFSLRRVTLWEIRKSRSAAVLP
jgi:hypothetical protein